MISIIITACREEKTIIKCITSITSQRIKEDYELLVIAPDEATLKAAKKACKKVKTIKDKGLGKWDALNQGFRKAKGRILILLDGDTYLQNSSINSLINAFNEEDTGIVSGRVISQNAKNNMLGYWSHLLVNAAHKERERRDRKKEFIICTGYLLGIRANIIKKLPENLLSEDAYMSHYVWSKGYDTRYAAEAKVIVKYPSNFKDWIKQKRRSTGGYHQLKKYFKKNPRMRSFTIEAVKGPFYALSYAKNLKELIWSLILFPARLYLWILTFYDKVSRKSFRQVWQRVESTK
ncbi:hypothetical protein COX58_03145 [archaeon CG_4_10_14_0_2_um_filter_Archaea_38_6]|nr:MAG: hypothetical protein COS83_03605 [archaeon CG07_land_8_20_14_0_80_38_8]PIU89552.1 MAG: hypothetical protein COS64_00505 [archaeon CG06_land_8_20_14_3_00_37_11]PIX43628.1 MAG: hypothetical protein COZ55_01050 [archaeon CG_4_8_14_3_um_filter_38_5]PJA21915.1 MAG: hypothetical protein COX58_03145 [archaeon CG_4_10_14_0_2_um_filter_Archaea_38_6]